LSGRGGILFGLLFGGCLLCSLLCLGFFLSLLLSGSGFILFSLLLSSECSFLLLLLLEGLSGDFGSK